MPTVPDLRQETDERLAETVAGRTERDASDRAAQDAFLELYERHARLLLAFLLARVPRAGAEDAHQTVWLRVWERLPSGFRGDNFRAWLFRIARNYLTDEWRRPETESMPEDNPGHDKRQRQPVEELIERERATILERCLKRLEDGNRLAAQLVRARLAGEGYGEICPRLRIDANRAYKLYHFAEKELRTCVEQATA